MRPLGWFLILLAGGAPQLPAGQSGGRAEYVGGTLAQMPNRSAGVILTADAEYFQFQTKKTTVRIPYQRIHLLEYGQKVDRRFVLGIVVSPLLLLSKKRRHFLTLGFTDQEGRQHAMVLQIHKDDVRPVLAALEVRTGRRVEYQDEEARKAGRG